MRDRNFFVIHNDLTEPTILNIEPEGVCFLLASGEEVCVIDQFLSQSVTIKLGKADNGGVVISVWPGDGEVRVEKGGVDLLDLAQEKTLLAP